MGFVVLLVVFFTNAVERHAHVCVSSDSCFVLHEHKWPGFLWIWANIIAACALPMGCNFMLGSSAIKAWRGIAERPSLIDPDAQAHPEQPDIAEAAADAQTQ